MAGLNITDIKVRLLGPSGSNLKAFVSVTLDDGFVIRDMKLVEHQKGLILVMPSRRVMDRCRQCGGKNHLQARFCNDCGAPLPEGRLTHDRDGRPKIYVDLVHPITSECREHLSRAVVDAFHAEVARGAGPATDGEDAAH